MIRLLQLAVGINLRSRLKFLLLTLLIALGVLVFLGVSELSRVSTDGLDQAIDSDLGATGTYRIEPSPALGLSLAQTLGTIRETVGGEAAGPLRVAVNFQRVHPECPPLEQIGEITAAVLLDGDGNPLPLREANGLQTGVDLCLAGLVVPRSALRETTREEKSAGIDAQILVDPVYAPSLRLTSTRPPGVTVILTTGRAQDDTERIRAALLTAFSPDAQRASVVLDDAVVVVRGDKGDNVRAASDGIRLVYLLIGWGVLLVGGLGILITELIVLRDRTWYFGLARAVGARRRDVASLILADIVLVLVAGFGAAAVVAVVTAPIVASFGRVAFSADVGLLRVQFLPQLVLGAAAMLLLGGVYPAWRATRLDPLEVLERR